MEMKNESAPAPKTSAKDFFVCLASHVALYVSAVAYLVLIFAILDAKFPAAGEYLGGSPSAIRSSIATLVVFFPALLYLLHLGIAELRAHPEKKELKVIKWMTYLTLFIAGLTMAIDLSTLVYRFLGAEDLTLRFILKVLSVFLVAFVIFYSGVSNLRRKDYADVKDIRIRETIVSLVVLLTVICGIAVIGSPSAARANMLDSERASDLAGIQSELVYGAWEKVGALPASLDELADPISGYAVPADPETGAPYGYQKLSATSFSLCADFSASSSANTLETAPAAFPASGDNWQHGPGETCFTRTIDPRIYPAGKPE